MLRDKEAGGLSLGRVISFIMVLFYLLYAGIVVINKQQLPDIPSNYMVLIISLYGIHKITPKLPIGQNGK